jgi:hypothetical protein
VILAEVEQKLREKHGVTGDQVREAVSLGAASRLTWDDDPRYGRRLIAMGDDEHGQLLSMLKPIDESDGKWECLTAWRL